jgi:nucleoid DNA-binding protein
MTKPELIDSIATETHLPKVDIERVLDALLNRASEALAAGERVEFRGFGAFEAKETKARKGRNPSTGETIDIPASRKASFRPSKELKTRLAAKREIAAS